MKITPILYSAAMARAKVAGIKTQTRRICQARTQNQCDILGAALADDLMGADDGTFEKKAWQSFKCPYGRPGDVLYGKESFKVRGVEEDLKTGRVILEGKYAADGAPFSIALNAAESLKFNAWKRTFGGHSSLFMFRSLSRIVDEIVEVRVERLQDITEDDAKAEGCERLDDGCKLCPQCGGTGTYTAHGSCLGALPNTDCMKCDTYAKRYRHLWKSINGPGSWDLNPWCWVIVTKPFEGALPS